MGTYYKVCRIIEGKAYSAYSTRYGYGVYNLDALLKSGDVLLYEENRTTKPQWGPIAAFRSEFEAKIFCDVLLLRVCKNQGVCIFKGTGRKSRHKVLMTPSSYKTYLSELPSDTVLLDSFTPKEVIK